jgi:hypothetical protein
MTNMDRSQGETNGSEDRQQNCSRKRNRENETGQDEEEESRPRRRQRPLMIDEIKEILTCPISLDIMRDPVVIVQSGNTYDREAIRQWLLRSPTR